MGLLWTGAILWGVFCSLGIFGAKGVDSFVFFLVAWVPTDLLVRSLIHRTSKRDAAHQTMLREAGVS